MFDFFVCILIAARFFRQPETFQAAFFAFFVCENRCFDVWRSGISGLPWAKKTVIVSACGAKWWIVFDNA
ncbi:hypothetical protein ACKLNO_07835 [Neisseriaceae bacterium B1]